MPDDAADPVAERSGWLFSIFAWYLVQRFRWAFSAVRVARGGLPRWNADRPVILFTNHPSWWDPALFIVLMRLLFPDRIGFGPMNADALRDYQLFRRFGVFGIALDRPAGAARFLRIAAKVLGDRRVILWLTAEGTFTDPRSRPLRLRPGLAHLARRHPTAQIVPMAMEYPFWDQSRPEAMIRFGSVLKADGLHTTAAWSQALHEAMDATMNDLADDVRSRDSNRFLTLIGGRGGAGIIYDGWRSLRGWLQGRREPVSRAATRTPL